ncbi:UDP-N-acetylmuramoyl-L-alanine--D-glutamate ligase [Aerococcus urinaeequi]|uniref:UDP-N-acetylmuramoyl-L-alanine--D-glutamate ligase n=1 Tax=Aerococcus urinaeequi TaxID=51665 RepID=UPI0039BCDCA1
MEASQWRESVRNKKILVLGLAKTGVSVVQHLQALGAIVTVNDFKPLEENKDAQSLIEENNTRVVAGGHPVSLLDEDFAFMVKNPGIPYSNPMVVRAQEIALPVYTDIELADKMTDATIIGITGSNGKTTTTSLVGEMLGKADSLAGESYIGGNIGIPSLAIASKAEADDRLILELSSFQLMGTDAFKPHIAAITNIYAAHLDYHGSMDGYISAKWQITANQTVDDFLILNADQMDVFGDRATKATVVPFSATTIQPDGVWFDQDSQNFMWHDEIVFNRKDFFLPGHHNLENMLVAVAIGKLLRISNEEIKNGVSAFHGVKHRLQFVAEIDGRRFYNDSKATNNDASITALDSFSQKHDNVIWLAGGLDRGNEVTELADHMDRVKGMVVFGQAADKFADLGQSQGLSEIEKVEWIEEAVKAAFDMSAPGDTILLSPASASWDQYPNFEVRGDRYIKAIEDLGK